MLGGELRPAAPFYVLGQRPHRFQSNFATFTAIDRSLRTVDRSKDFGAATLTFNPQRHCSLHGVLGTFKSATGDGLSDEILLLGSEVYLHNSNVAGQT
jgi:hypothetical protein